MTRKNIYVLSTGGTIAMQPTPYGYAPAPGYIEKAMAKLPELQNADMPRYTIEEYEQPIDSANMTIDHWYAIGERIEKNYKNYDGFVILHGTDSMAYSASALSFMLENLAKPVIFTGSQLPLFETRNDARENLINALWMASNYSLPEVCIYFHNKLFRGNRCKKMDASHFAAFSSPNFPVLAKVGTEIKLRQELIREMPATTQLNLQRLTQTVIGTLRIFPGLSMELLQNLLRQPLQALILETYGVGTAPENPDFLQKIRSATEQGILIINCSQCVHAKVTMNNYSAGTALLNRGVISGGDMTIEAIITKLFYLFSKKLSLSEIKVQMMENLRGEMR